LHLNSSTNDTYFSGSVRTPKKHQIGPHVTVRYQHWSRDYPSTEQRPYNDGQRKPQWRDNRNESGSTTRINRDSDPLRSTGNRFTLDQWPKRGSGAGSTRNNPHSRDLAQSIFGGADKPKGRLDFQHRDSSYRPEGEQSRSSFRRLDGFREQKSSSSPPFQREEPHARGLSIRRETAFNNTSSGRELRTFRERPASNESTSQQEQSYRRVSFQKEPFQRSQSFGKPRLDNTDQPRRVGEGLIRGLNSRGRGERLPPGNKGAQADSSVVENTDLGTGADEVTDTFEEESKAKKWQKKAAGLSRKEELMKELDDEGNAVEEVKVKEKKPKGARRVARDDEDEDDIELALLERIEEKRRRKEARKALQKAQKTGPQLNLPEFISIGNLATLLKIRAEAFTPKLAAMGFENLNNDYIIDAETSGLIATEFGYTPVLPAKTSETDLVARPPPDETAFLVPRPPIVTIMGHVDHGKTTLLDWLRNASVAANEFGGITQHIGAFTVQMSSGRIITFLDTPGHAAFLEMRARGANVTDIVILVVAADDSVKPQTIEAIKHAKAANVQIVVAITKIDKEDANPQRVKQDLARHGIEVEDFGGDTQTVCVSGKPGQGMEDLEEAVITLSDVLDVQAEPTGPVEGWVLEASQKKLGKVATVLVRRGTLAPDNVIVAGRTWARVRSLRNEAGIEVLEATPGTPVEVDGWRELPEAGAEVLQAPDEKRARRVVGWRAMQAQAKKLAADVVVINETRKAEEEKRRREKEALEAAENGEDEAESSEDTSKPKFTQVPLVIKADVSGSSEAVRDSILALGNSEVRATVLRAGVGSVSPNDVEYAAAAKGHVISFNLHIDAEVRRLAENNGVKILDGNIIYKVVDDVKSVLEDKLAPAVISRVTGEAEISQIFEISLKGKNKLLVAGCKVRNGTMTKGSKAKIVRNGEVVYDGKQKAGHGHISANNN
jgi:translation initiation factor IF-2